MMTTITVPRTASTADLDLVALVTPPLWVRLNVTQAQVLAYADEFFLIAMMFLSMLMLIPFMRRVRADPRARRSRRATDVSRASQPLRSSGS